MSPSAREYLQHILDEVAYLAAKAHGLDKTSFLRDPTLKRAFARSIEIIGEAAKQVPYLCGSVRRKSIGAPSVACAID